MCTRMEDRSWPSPQFCTEVLFGLKAENWLQMAITMSSWNIINSVLITENTAMERLRFASSTPLRLHAVAYVASCKCTIETKFWMSHMNQNSKQPYTNGKKKHICKLSFSKLWFLQSLLIAWFLSFLYLSSLWLMDTFVAFAALFSHDAICSYSPWGNT